MLNLDAMSESQLWNLYIEFNNHIRISAKKYGLSVKDAKNIRAYAINKYVAMDLRGNGEISEAMKYEAICERLYSELSESVQW